MNFLSNSWTLRQSTYRRLNNFCAFDNLTSRTKGIYSEVNNHQVIKIKKLYGKMADNEAEVQTNYTLYLFRTSL